MTTIDLHTHTLASSDGSLRLSQYREMLQHGPVDYVAVTDHNTVTMALVIHEQLGDRIIVGEEISTAQGDLIGLYLTECVPAGLSARETAERIHAQGGLVYVPHPFDRLRKGLVGSIVTHLDGVVDIVEVYNGRSLDRGSNQAARAWATSHRLPGAASSDAHGLRGWGRTYTSIVEAPARETLCALLAQASYTTIPPTICAVLYPGINRLRKRMGTRWSFR